MSNASGFELNLFSGRTLSLERRALLLNFSLVMEFLRNIFTNFIFEKLL